MGRTHFTFTIKPAFKRAATTTKKVLNSEPFFLKKKVLKSVSKQVLLSKLERSNNLKIQHPTLLLLLKLSNQTNIRKWIKVHSIKCKYDHNIFRTYTVCTTHRSMCILSAIYLDRTDIETLLRPFFFFFGQLWNLHAFKYEAAE